MERNRPLFMNNANVMWVSVIATAHHGAMHYFSKGRKFVQVLLERNAKCEQVSTKDASEFGPANAVDINRMLDERFGF